MDFMRGQSNLGLVGTESRFDKMQPNLKIRTTEPQYFLKNGSFFFFSSTTDVERIGLSSSVTSTVCALDYATAGSSSDTPCCGSEEALK